MVGRCADAAYQARRPATRTRQAPDVPDRITGPQSNKEEAIVPFNLIESGDQHKTADGKAIMSENTGSERPVIPRRVVQVLPFIIFALVALTVGLLASDQND